MIAANWVSISSSYCAIGIENPLLFIPLALCINSPQGVISSIKYPFTISLTSTKSFRQLECFTIYSLEHCNGVFLLFNLIKQLNGLLYILFSGLALYLSNIPISPSVVLTYSPNLYLFHSIFLSLL